jgi:O-antigen/teichoic acid export membrane protein
MDQTNLNRRIASSTKWSSITVIFSKLVTPITNMILARVLAPEMFGVVATITMVVTFSDMFTDAGFQKYLVQHDFGNDKDLTDSTNVAFWTNLIFSIFIWLIILTFNVPIARLVGSEGKGKAIVVASLVIPVLSFSSIQMALYRRRFDFKTLFKARMVTSLLPLVVTVPLALVLKSYWALIFGNLINELTNAIILTVKSPWKPKLYFSVDKLKEMLSFSVWSLFEQISIWLTSNIGIFVVGRFLNEYYLGLYKTTINTVNAYMAIITAATTPVLFAALSRCQNDEPAFRNIYFKFQRYVAILVMPMGIGLFLYRDLATQILLGSQWAEASEFIGLWALTSAFTIIFGHYNSEVYRSKGKPKLSLLSQSIHLIFLVVLLFAIAPLGFRILYIGRSLARIQAIITGLIIMWVCFRISFLSIIKNVYPSILSSVAMGCIAIALQQVSQSIVWSLISVLICIVTYFCILLLFPQMRKEWTCQDKCSR